jgi:hypothetical protein
MEHRHEIVENGTDAYLAEVGAAYKLHPTFLCCCASATSWKRNTARARTTPPA